ncbi:MAG: serpin family protein [Acidimicrobiia bacterium]
MNRVVVSLLAVVAVSACGGAEVLEPVGSDIAFEASASSPEVAAVAASDMLFTVDLLRALADGDNVFVSPISISTALGMVAAGAEGQTRAEIAEVLHETLPDDSVHAARGSAFADW